MYKIRLKKIKHPILYFLIVLLFIVGSYQQVFPTLCDEVLLLIMILYVVIYSRGVKNRYLFSVMGFIIIGFLTSLIRIIDDTNTVLMFFSEIANTIKPLIVLLAFSSITIKTSYRNGLLVGFVLVNIPSFIVSVYQYRNRGLGFSIGLKVRNGMGRIMGLSGHPITFGFILATIILILFSCAIMRNKADGLKRKEIIYRDLLLLVCFLLFVWMTYTQSRYPQFLSLLIGVSIIVLRKNNTTRVVIILAMITLAILFGIIYFPRIMSFMEVEKNSVRFVGVQTGLKSLLKYPLLGTGIGTFGTLSSFNLHSYVYDVFSISYSSQRVSNLVNGNYFETGFFKIVVENGIIGMLLYYYIVFDYLRKSISCREFLDYSILALFSLNSILNPVYRLPVIFVAGVCIAHLNYVQTILFGRFLNIPASVSLLSGHRKP